jgi:Ca-activated chloride channel family protein
MDTIRFRSVCAVLACAAVLTSMAAAAQKLQREPAAAAQRSRAAPPAQDVQAAPPARGFADQISVSWVLVPVLVRERGGAFVDDLERGDFRLLVDGEPVAIESFDRGRDAPVSLVVLQDLSGSMENGGKIETSRRALRDLVARVRPGDEIALATFAGERLAVDVPFTGNRGALGEAMALWHPYGTTALHDAVAWIPEISSEGRHPKRAVLLVTDGVDNASAIAPDRARGIVERAHLPVYVVGLGTHGAAPAAENGAAADSYARLLQRLARASGGYYHAARRPEDVPGAVQATLAALRREYVLGFPAADSGAPVFRSIAVEVRGGRLIAHHRLGYTGGPPADVGGAGASPAP